METAMAAAVVSADRIKTLPGAILVVIGYNVDATYTQLVRDLATPGYYFDIRDIDELRRTIEQLPGIICEFGARARTGLNSTISSLGTVSTWTWWARTPITPSATSRGTAI
jgi:hypothetical protein